MRPTHRSAVLGLLGHNVVTNDLSVFLSVLELRVTTPRNPFIPFAMKLNGACLSESVCSKQQLGIHLNILLAENKNCLSAPLKAENV